MSDKCSAVVYKRPSIVVYKRPAAIEKCLRNSLRQTKRFLCVEKTPISRLPPELMLEIAASLPAGSRACLALSCRSMWNILDDGFPALRIPAEYNIWKTIYSPLNILRTRRKFLRNLERGKKLEQRFCRTCCMLHPLHFFSEDFRRCLMKEHKIQPPEPQSIPAEGAMELCPCRYVTPETARQLIEDIKSGVLNRYDERSVQHTPKPIPHKRHTFVPWHSCRHNYGDKSVSIKLCPNLRDDLTFITHYEYSFDPKIKIVGPRLICPHIYLDTLVATVALCRKKHPFGQLCRDCYRFMKCCFCNATLLNFKFTTETKDLVECSFQVWRHLKGDWNRHIVYPRHEIRVTWLAHLVRNAWTMDGRSRDRVKRFYGLPIPKTEWRF